MYNLWNMLAYLWYIFCFKKIQTPKLEEEEWGQFVDLDDSSFSCVLVEPTYHYRTLREAGSFLRLGHGIV